MHTVAGERGHHKAKVERSQLSERAGGAAAIGSAASSTFVVRGVAEQNDGYAHPHAAHLITRAA